jgi:ABC-type uncharacterized transport system substrate-binding protein
MAVALLCLAACLTGCKNTPRSASADQDRSAASDRSVTAETQPQKVLLVHSYNAGYPWTDAVTRGVRMSLPTASVDLQVVYMDTKRKTDEAWKQQAGRRVRDLIATWQPDVVIASDDNAQKYAVADLAGRDDIAIVFCGLNGLPEDYGYPASNVTGVLERPHFADSLAMLKRICPDVRRVAFITDSSPTSAATIRYMKAQRADVEIVSWSTPRNFGEWQRAVDDGQQAADALAIYTYHTVQPNQGGESMQPEEVMAWTVDHCGVPVVGFLVFAVDDGAMCGLAESGTEHGMLAGKLAGTILDGTPAGTLPIVTATEGQSMLNLDSAHRLGIDVPAAVIEATNVVVGQQEPDGHAHE